jgi:hypothetical protein
MESINTKVKAKKLVDFESLDEMALHAWLIVHEHCRKEFYDSWNSISLASVDVISEEFFFRNYLWCVYVSGFSAKAVTANYDKLLVAHNLVDVRGRFVPSEIASPPDKDQVFKIWRNHAKFNAIFKTRAEVREGWSPFRKRYLEDRDPLAMQNIAFMGPALSMHLARNLGAVQLVKPDVHLVRLAKKFGFDTAHNLCLGARDACPRMAHWPLGKVDLLLWYAAATIRS